MNDSRASSHELLAAALAYAARAWRVVSVYTVDGAGRCSCRDAECSRPGKHPAGAERGIHDATCDEAQIREWWRKHPNANVGIVAGERSGILALDIDPRNGGTPSLDEIESAHGRLPDTISSLTGGGGRHYLFRLPAGITGQCEPAPGIEIYAREHLLVLPPSRHASGKRYEWAPDFSPEEMTLADPPQWILDALAEAGAKQTALAAPAHDCGVPIPKGSRHNALVALAGALRSRSFSSEALEAALAVTNRQRCQPPLDNAEVARIARDIGAKAALSDPAGGVVAAGERDRQILAAAETAFALVNDATVVEPPSIIGDGIAPRGSTVMMAGQGGIGKSWLVIRLVLSVARGEPWIGLETMKGRAGVISFELPRWSLRKRILVICGDDHRGLEDLIVLGREAALGLKLPRDVDLVARLIRDNGLDIVAIDPFAAIQEAPGDSGADVGPTLEALLRLAVSTDAVVLTAHHVSKPVGAARRDPIDLVRGHSRLRDDVDAVLVVEPAHGLRRLTFAKVRHGITPDPVWIGPTGDVTSAPETAKSHRVRNIDATLELLLANPGERFTAEQVVEVLGLRTPTGDPLKAGTVRRYLRELTEAGLAEAAPSSRKSDPKAWRSAVAVTDEAAPSQHDEET